MELKLLKIYSPLSLFSHQNPQGNMKPEEARIAAHVCSDGWMSTYVEKDSLQIVNGRRYHRDRRRYEVGYCNTNKKLLEEFSKDVLGVYKIRVRRRKSTDLVFKSKRVFSRIKELGGGNTQGWRIGKEILESKKIVKIFWLRAFFDDEGTVDRTNFVVRVKSIDRKSTRLNSSHGSISYAVFCLKTKQHTCQLQPRSHHQRRPLPPNTATTAP